MNRTGCKASHSAYARSGITQCPHCLGSLADLAGSPFVVPPFDVKWKTPEVRFYWWSWHPNYPQWSRYGSKGYTTEDDAWQQRENPIHSSTLDYYHNKLVREGDGAFTVVADDPCRKLDVWREIKAKMKNDQAQRPGSPDGSLATETRKPGSLK